MTRLPKNFPFLRDRDFPTPVKPQETDIYFAEPHGCCNPEPDPVLPIMCGGCGKRFRTHAALRLHFTEQHAGQDVPMCAEDLRPESNRRPCDTCKKKMVTIPPPQPGRQPENVFCCEECRTEFERIGRRRRWKNRQKRIDKARTEGTLKTCAIEGCDGHCLKGVICSKHVARVTKWGSPWALGRHLGGNRWETIDERTGELINGHGLRRLANEWFRVKLKIRKENKN